MTWGLNQMLSTSVPDADTAPCGCSFVTGFFLILVQVWGAMTDGLGGQGDRTKEGRDRTKEGGDRRYPGAKRFS